MIAARHFTLIAALLVAPAAGCSTSYFRAETAIQPDGSLDRAICQPDGSTPEEVRNSKAWQGTRWVKKIAINRRDPLIRDLPEAKEDIKNRRFVAWGRFAAAKDIPDHFSVESEPTGRAGRLVRNYARRDLGFVVEHSWTETLTDIVEFEDLLKARRTLVTLYVSLVIEALEDRFGDEYDLSRLKKWLSGEATRWVLELLDLDLEFALKRESLNSPAVQKRAILLLARHGLKFTDQKGNLFTRFEDISEERFRAIAGEFARGKLSRLIRHQGGPPPDDVIDEILGWSGFVGVDLVERPATEGKSPLSLAWDAAVIRRFGSEKKFDERSVGLSHRSFGVYRLPFDFTIFDNTRHFDYMLTVPGVIVETNGVVESERGVRWKFTDKQAFPFGYVMRCRSLAVPERAGKLMPKPERLADRGGRLRYVALVGSDQALARAARRAVADGKLAPLEAHRARVVAGGDAVALQRLDRLWRLLALPVDCTTSEAGDRR